LRHLVDPDRVDRPVSLSERRRVIADIVDARAPAVLTRRCWTVSILGEDIASIIAAEVRVDDNAHIVEVLVYRALSLCIIDRQSKLCHVWCAIGDAAGNVVASEIPGLDIVRCPLGCVDSTTVVVQSTAVVIRCRGVIRCRAAARVLIDILVTITCLEVATLCSAGDRAVDAGMQGH